MHKTPVELEFDLDGVTYLVQGQVLDCGDPAAGGIAVQDDCDQPIGSLCYQGPVSNPPGLESTDRLIRYAVPFGEMATHGSEARS